MKNWDEIKNYYNLTTDGDLIKKFKNIDRKEIATLSKLAHKCAIKNDKCAIEIFDKAAYELAKCANVLYKNFVGEVILTYCGSVFNSGDVLLNPLKKYLNDNLKISKPIFSPEEGAFLIMKHDKNFVSF